jgi:hypothetical protein
MRRIATALSIASLTSIGLVGPALASEVSTETLRVVCANEGGNGRYWISFGLLGNGAVRPEVGSAPVHAFGDTARDGWVELPDPNWVQPGTIVTSIDGTSSQHGRVTAIRLTYGAATAPTVPDGYHEDCSYAGFPNWPVPLNLHLTRVDATTATVAWATETTGTKYTIGWFETTPPQRFWQSGHGAYGPSSTPLTLKGLRPSSSYRIFIVPVRDGQEDWSQWQEVPAQTPAAPTVGRTPWISGSAGTRTVTINWGQAPGAQTYMVSWRELSTGRTWSSHPDYRGGPVTLTGLRRNSTYSVTVTPCSLPTQGSSISANFRTR